jgi:riboflavin kinase/FMN adenylyltransferase
MSRLFRDAAGPCLAPRGSVVAIGAFDGVHCGHQVLLDAVGARARALGLPAVAVSFEPLPRQYFMGRNAIARLTTPRDKLALLAARVDLVGLLRFTAALASTSAEAFVDQVLVERLAAREVWVGPEFRFGHARRGDVALLAGLGAARGFTAHTVEPLMDGIERISSSRIRTALRAGDFASAARWLGRPFTMAGHVARGQRLGRRLGYPTANLPLRHGLAPVQGIFAVRVDGAGLVDHPGVASLGTRPTVGGVEPLLEAHLFDFDGDLYGRRLDVRFVARLRDEVRFDSLDALVAQMDRDAAQARALLGVARESREPAT